MANQINEPSPQLSLKDSVGNSVAFYKRESAFYILVLGSHLRALREEVPKLDSIYEARWKDLGVKNICSKHQ